MFAEKLEKTYTITLPTCVCKEILEWFETLNASNNLSEEIIHLVSLSLREKRPYIPPPTQEMYSTTELSNFTADNNDFFNNLYNWQEASSQIFEELQPKAELKQKKKMLSV